MVHLTFSLQPHLLQFLPLSIHSSLKVFANPWSSYILFPQIQVEFYYLTESQINETADLSFLIESPMALDFEKSHRSRFLSEQVSFLKFYGGQKSNIKSIQAQNCGWTSIHEFPWEGTQLGLANEHESRGVRKRAISSIPDKSQAWILTTFLLASSTSFLTPFSH